jgi:non-ribosomal peptide synthetase component F
MTLLAALKILLFYYTEQTEIIIGGVAANRNQPETQDLIGLMVQFLPLYTHVEYQANFRDLLHQVKEMSLEFDAYQEIPFITLVEKLKPIRDSQYALFHQVIFLFQNAPKQDLKLINLTVTDELSKMDIDAHSAENDLTISLEETEQGIKGAFVYKADLFTTETITQMEQYFQQLLKNIVTDPDKTISDLCPLSESVSFSGNTSPLSLSINEIKSNDLPHNLTRETVINIWQEVLELEEISVNDNFFDLGGDSQKVIQVIDKIGKIIKINCTLRDFFDNPTIARLITTFKNK